MDDESLLSLCHPYGFIPANDSLHKPNVVTFYFFQHWPFHIAKQLV